MTPPAPDDEPRPLEHIISALPEIAVGAAIGYAAGLDPALAGALGPTVVAILRTGYEADKLGIWRAARAIQTGAEHAGVAPEAIETIALSDPARTELWRRVVQAAARSTIEEKIDALGRVLALGLADDEQTDEALLLAAALADMQAREVRVLTRIGDASEVDAEAGTATGGITADALAEDLPNGRRTLLPAIQTLTRHALIFETSQTLDGGDLGAPAAVSYLPSSTWALTDTGERCLELLGYSQH